MLAHVGPSPWEWHAHPDVWLLVASVVVGYWWAVTRLGPSKVGPGEPVVSRRQVTCFGLGAAVLWLHADWPVHDIGEHYLFSVHMVQHIGFTLVAVPLLLAGTPPWLLRWLVSPRGVRGVLSVVARPLPAGLAYNTVLVLTHWPLVVDASLRNHAVHFGVHFVLVASAVVMWLPVLNRIPELPAMSYPGRCLYLFLQSVVPTVPASFLTFGTDVMYRFYEEVARPFPMSALEDQQVAGALMKVYGGFLLWAVIAATFFRWYSREDRDRRMPAVLTWDDVERELRRTSPPTPRT